MHSEGKQNINHSALPGIHVFSGSDSDTAGLLVPFSSEDTGKVVIVHQVSFSPKLTILLRRSSAIFLLVFGKDQFCTPAAFAAATFPFSVGAAMDRLRNAKNVSSIIPLHILLQVHLELSVGVGGA